jgi:hypothetical protein
MNQVCAECGTEAGSRVATTPNNKSFDSLTLGTRQAGMS